MGQVRVRDTGPELALRSALHGLGYRFRVDHRIPGSRYRPDIVFTRAKVAVFVHGCFWHGCADHGPVPTSNRQWWLTKFEQNRERDERARAVLNDLGWVVVTVWEHDALTVAIERVVEHLPDRPLP